ncbi:MAG: caleosin family protein [Candidatus Sericytochromatia bacterium]
MLTPRPYNAMQRHGAFFDADNDHKVTVKETAEGLQDLGLSAKKAGRLAPIVNIGLALPQKNFKTIELDRLQANIDPKTPGAFDAVGNFDAAKFEAMFAFDGGKTGSLTQAEVGRLIDASALSAIGKFRTKAGYGLLFEVAADTQKPVLDASGKPVLGKDGKPQVAPALTRERLKSFFLGTIFHDIAAAKGNPRPVHDGLTRKAP